ncbi:MAG: MBL fold metallo-hydrolase [bacterium]
MIENQKLKGELKGESIRKEYFKNFGEKETGFGKVFGSPYTFLYILGDVLFDSSVSAWAYLMCQKIGQRKLFNKVFLTHSHYDHIGGAWVIKKYFPDVKFYGHSNINKVLLSQNALKTIEDFNNKDSEEVASVWNETKEYLNFVPISLDNTFDFQNGFIIDCEGVRCIYSPGHTRDTVSFYVSDYNALVMSESMGIPNHRFNFVLPEFLSSYKLYVDSYQRLKEIVISRKVKNFLLPHIMYFEYHSDVIDFLRLSEESLENYVKFIVFSIDKVKIDKNNVEDKKVEEVFDFVFEKFYVNYELSQPLYGFKANVTSQIKTVIKELI